MISVGIADDHTLFRQGIKQIIEQNMDYKVTVQAENGRELIEQLEDNKPEILLVDLKMPELDGIETTKSIRKSDKQIKIIILSMYDHEKYIRHMFEVGANGYLLKNAEPSEVFKAMKMVQSTGYYFTEKISRIIAQGLAKRSRSRPSLDFPFSLTNREIEVLELICEGLTTQEIAERLYLSSRTIEGHRQKLLDKTNTKNTAGLVAWAFKNNFAE